MRPGNLMWLGFCGGLLAMALSAVDTGAVNTVVAFGGGMLFGKGYGVWEERGRP